jgi:hypothetical protein
MLTKRIAAGFILAGLTGLSGAMIAGGDANAQSGTTKASKLSACLQECDGDTACRQACGDSFKRRRRSLRTTPVPVPPRQPVASWQDEVFTQGAVGGGGGGGGGGGR